MNYRSITYLCMMAALGLPSCAVADAAAHRASPYIAARSQSVAAAREIAGWQYKINRCDVGDYYGSFTITPEFTQTFRPCDIADSIFGPDLTTNAYATDDGCCGGSNCSDNNCCSPCTTVITVSGSQVADRGEHDWLADYFGLPVDFVSTLNFAPRVRNAIIDLNYYVGLGDWHEGLFFRIHAPIVWTQWKMNFQETVVEEGTAGYVRGYFSDLPVLREDLVFSAGAFLTGCSAPTILGSVAGGSVTNPIGSPITFQKLQYSKIHAYNCQDDCNLYDENNCRSNCTNVDQERFGLSDIEMALGWNFACNDDYHVGLELRLSAPTGNRPSGEYLFEPIVGNGKHWGLGAGFTTHYIFWKNEERDSEIGIWVDANVQHLFSAWQVRSFDLHGKPNSRYALAQRLGTHHLDVSLGGDADAGYEWQNEFAPIANLTTSMVSVKIAAEGNFVAKFAYTNGNGSQFDIGYEYWGRSCECICPLAECPPELVRVQNAWALKGDAFVVGFQNDGDGDPDTDVPVRLAATESQADIHGGTNNFPNGIGITSYYSNPGVDNAVLAIDNDGGTEVLNFVTDAQTSTSNPVVFITQNLVGYNDASTKGSSSTLFGHFSHTWLDHEKQPFIGIGAYGEFANRGTLGSGYSDCCAPTNLCQADCNDTTLNQWGVWIKGGISFE